MQQFKTKKAAIEHFRKYLNGTQEGQPLDAAAFDDVMWLIKRHPSASEKIGCGIASIYVRRNPTFPSQRSFWIQRADGSETDFSYLRCIDGKDKSAQHWFVQACRWAVVKQILAFKQRAFAAGCATCSVTGQLVGWSSCHVDHESPQFAALVASFVTEFDIDVESVAVSGCSDNECAPRFASPAMHNMWSEYHRKHATLRIVTAEINLKRKRNGQ
jgi:hypothetical protein